MNSSNHFVRGSVFLPGLEASLAAFRAGFAPGEEILLSFFGTYDRRSGKAPILWKGTWALSNKRLLFMGQGKPHRKFQPRYYMMGGRWRGGSGVKKDAIITIPYARIKKLERYKKIQFLILGYEGENPKKKRRVLMIPHPSKTSSELRKITKEERKIWKQRYLAEIEAIHRLIVRGRHGFNVS